MAKLKAEVHMEDTERHGGGNLQKQMRRDGFTVKGVKGMKEGERLKTRRNRPRMAQVIWMILLGFLRPTRAGR